jgi:glycosyltransferase involved in cell wall biosynthesis
MSPFCNIFLPVRNGGDYVIKAIDSVLAQSIPDWRLVVLENGSTDNTRAVLARYTDPRITVVPASEPLSMFDNWDRGRQLLADGAHAAELVTFIGHDDWLYPDFLAQARTLVHVHPDATLYQTAFDLVDEHGAMIRPCRPVPRIESWDDLAAAICWGIRDSFGTGYLFRPADYVAVGGIPDLPMLLASDDLLFIRLAARGYKAASPNAGCAYRLHRGSTSGAISATRIDAHVEALASFIDMLQREHHFAEGDQGRAALACLIAREILPYNSMLVRRKLSPRSRSRIDALVERQGELAPHVRSQRWLGSNVVTADLYALTRRWFLAGAMLRAGS